MNTDPRIPTVVVNTQSWLKFVKLAEKNGMLGLAFSFIFFAWGRSNNTTESLRLAVVNKDVNFIAEWMANKESSDSWFRTVVTASVNKLIFGAKSPVIERSFRIRQLPVKTKVINDLTWYIVNDDNVREAMRRKSLPESKTLEELATRRRRPHSKKKHTLASRIANEDSGIYAVAVDNDYQPHFWFK